MLINPIQLLFPLFNSKCLKGQIKIKKISCFIAFKNNIAILFQNIKILSYID